MPRFPSSLFLGMIICSMVMLAGCCGDGFQGMAYERRPDGDIGPTIPAVKITFVKEDATVTKTVVTDDAGSYRICVRPGRYTVTATHPEYEDYCSLPAFFVATGDGYQTGNFFLRQPTVTTVLLVRHAEKVSPYDGPDGETPLTLEGQERAQKLAHVAGKAGVTAIYTTNTERTRQTVQPLADALNLQPIIYGDLPGLVNQVLSDHKGDVVLVAGHSNTVPQIAQLLGANISGQYVDDFDNLFVVTRKASGVANAVNLQYGESSLPDIAQSHHPMPTLLLVRHGEGGIAGAARAEKLAHVARTAGVSVIFTTPPQQTVQSLADVLNLQANSYPPNGVQGIITQVLEDTSQLFVVAGQKDNLSEIIQGLGGHPTPPIFANEYDNLFLITISEPNRAKVVSLQYGEPSP